MQKEIKRKFSPKNFEINFKKIDFFNIFYV